MPQPWAEWRSPFGAQAQLFHTKLTAMHWTTDIFWSYKSVNYFWGNMKDASVCKSGWNHGKPSYHQITHSARSGLPEPGTRRISVCAYNVRWHKLHFSIHRKGAKDAKKIILPWMDDWPLLPIQLHHLINSIIVQGKYDAKDMLYVISTGYESVMRKQGMQNGYKCS